MGKLHIEPEWRERLQWAGLANLEVLLSFEAGEMMSVKKMSRTQRYHLPDGQVIYIKQDTRSSKRTMLRSLMRFQIPQPVTEKERRIIKKLPRLDFKTPKIIAWGQRRRWAFPDVGVMVLLAIEGVCLEAYLKEETDPEKRRQAVQKAQSVLQDLQRSGCDWKKDCKPEHFFLNEAGEITILDVERMRFRGRPLAEKTCRMQIKRFTSLLPGKAIVPGVKSKDTHPVIDKPHLV
ncbi:MAG: lipopolysaccharide kinase InaA family protein [Syntrophobacteraceae bacterium]